MELLEWVLRIFAVYYLGVFVLSQLVLRLAEWRTFGTPFFRWGEVSVLLVGLMIPFWPAWPDWGRLFEDIRYGREAMLKRH